MSVAARVTGGILAQHSHRVIDPKARPSALLFALFHGLRGALPDLVGRHLTLHLLLGVRLEEVPLQVVFADVVFAEPVKVVEHVGRLGRAVFAGLLAPGGFAGALRGLDRAGHAPTPLGAARLIGFRGNIELKWIKRGACHDFTFSTRSTHFRVLCTEVKSE